MPSVTSSFGPRDASTGLDTSIPCPQRELCFDPAVLIPHQRELDIAEFIATTRMKAPLSLIKDDLRSLLESIQNELVSCVQRDFDTFVSLGSSVAAVDGLADAASAPLTSMQGDVGKLVDSIDDEIKTLSRTLEERRAISEKTDALQILLRTNDLLQKCERLLKVYSSYELYSEEALRLLERMAGENAQLSFSLSRAGNGSFVRHISPRISFVRRSIRNHLESWLRRALFPQTVPCDGSPYDTEILGRVLDSFVVAGMPSDAEDFFRREVVAPFTSERIRMAPMLAIAEREKKEKLAQNQDGMTAKSQKNGKSAQAQSDMNAVRPLQDNFAIDVNVTGADALEAAERVIIQFLGERLMPIASLCETQDRLRTSLDFVGRAVWPQVAGAIAAHMSSAFSPGIADVSHQSVLSGTRIFAAMEAAAISEKQLESLRRSQTTIDFWRHWNLPVYFQLRFQEITSKYDNALQKGPTPAGSTTSEGSVESSGRHHKRNFSSIRLLRSDPYHTQATVAMIDALRTCWSKHVYLKPLAHRFLRLSLQLLTRYRTWVQTGLAGEWSEGDALPSGGARVLSDLALVQKRVPAEFSSYLRLMDIGIDGKMMEEMDSIFTSAVSQFQQLHPELVQSISDCLTRACVENLQPLRGILATYRMSSKPSPTTNSPFVPKILRPLKLFLQEHRGRVDNQVCAEISTAVAEGTGTKYHEMATDLISSNKKSEETLRRLNIGRSMAADASGTGSSSTTDKVSMQLYLDVAKFKDDIEELGIDPDGIPSVALLWNSVKRRSSRDDQTSAEIHNASENAE